MEKNNMYFDTQKAKLYKNYYRPSFNIYRFIKSLLSVIVAGQSPLESSYYYHKKRK